MYRHMNKILQPTKTMTKCLLTGKKMKIPEASPYKTWSPLLPQPKQAKNDFNLNTSILTELPSQEDIIKNIVSQNAVVVFGRHGCCMCYVIKRLFQGLGANPVVREIGEADLKYFDGKLAGNCQFPVVFISGQLYGGLDRMIAMHISGELIPVLKQAGALWL